MIDFKNIIVDTVLMLTLFIFSFFLVYAIIPEKVIGFEYRNDSFLDRLFISLIHSNFITIIIVHILAFLKIYETLSLVVFYLLAYRILYRLTKSKDGNKDYFEKKIVKIADLLDCPPYLIRIEIKKKLSSVIRKFIVKISGKLSEFFIKPSSGILVFIVICIAAYIRFQHSVTNLYFGASDAYVHFEWAKFLNNNNIYQGGIYPNGYHSIISALSKVTFIDSYYIVRFIGPLGGVLIVLSIYYFMSRTYRNEPLVAFISTLIYASGVDLPIVVWRQISALPQEYATIFLLPGMYFLNMYFNSKKNYFLILAGECFCLTLLIHPYVTVFSALGYLIIILINVKQMFDTRLLVRIIVTAAASSVLGVLPLLVGYLAGKKFHGSLGYIEVSVKFPSSTSTEVIPSAGNIKTGFYENILLLKVFLICITLIIILWLSFAVVKRNRTAIINIKSDIIIVLTSIVLYLLFRPEQFHLPALMDLNRIGIFLSIFVSCSFSLVIAFILRLIKGRRLNLFIKSLMSLLVVIIMVRYSNFSPPVGVRYQYNEAVYGYLKAKIESYPLEWTIISPVEEYSACIGYGWHYELSDFITQLSDSKVEKIEIPTEMVYIFIEKNPLADYKDTKMHVSEEYAKKDLPRDLAKLSDIYAYAESRTILESKAYYWARDYMQKHDNMQIVFENENIQIYKIKQDTKNFINFKKE